MEYREYIHKFRHQPTSKLVKQYATSNAQFRQIAREEFKKRHVPISKLPYKKRAQTSRGLPGLFSNMGSFRL